MHDQAVQLLPTISDVTVDVQVLHDPEVPKKQLYARARAVQGLGSIFGGVAKSIDAEPVTPEVVHEPKFYPNPKSPFPQPS